MTAAEKLTNPPVGQWIHVARAGDRVWVDDEEVPLEVFEQFCGVNKERESDRQGSVGIPLDHGEY